jgi:hypothetical protein
VLAGFTTCAALSMTTLHAESMQGCNAASITVPSTLRLVCSATWKFEGPCVGTDMWDKWKITGRTNPAESFVTPFEDVPITVVGYELLKLQDARGRDERNNHLSWFMIGSGVVGQPDAMIWLGPGETRVRQIWPSGMGQLWPAKVSGGPDKLDLHGVCFGGAPITLFLTIYYSPRPK